MTRAANRAGGSLLAALVALGSVVAFFGLRWLYLSEPWRIDWATFPMFLGDEGAHGMMARHIREGALPVFYYGAYYHGAFDAYLSAALFGLFGESLLSLRLLPGLCALASVLLTFALGRRLYGTREGLLAAALVAVPSKFFFEWGTLSLCGYCGYATFVVLIAALTLRLLGRVSAGALVLLGVAAGVSVWSNQLSAGFVVVALAALWLWAPMTRRDWTLLAIALVVGAAPLIYGNIQTPFSTFRQLARKALFAWTLSKQEAAKAPEVAEDEQDEREYHAHPLLEVLGAQPGRDGAFSGGGVFGAAVLAFGIASAAAFAWRARGTDPLTYRRHLVLLALIGLTLVLGIGGFSGQPIGRYQLPLYPLAAALTAGALVRLSPLLAAAVVALVVAAHGLDIARPAVTDETTPVADVIAALDERGLRRGFAASPMYDVVFRSGERIIVVPLDHSRYVPYEKQVDGAPDLFYVYRSYQERKPAHRAFLRYLAGQGVTYAQLDVGDFHVLHGFSPPDALSLGTLAKVRAEFRKEKFGR